MASASCCKLALSCASCSRIRRSSAVASFKAAIVPFRLAICSTIFVRLVSPSAIDWDKDNNARAASSLMPPARAPWVPPVVLLSLNRAKADSQSSNSLKKRPIACPNCRSRKPRMSDPPRPKSDDEKAVAIPDSGASRPDRNCVIIA